MAEILPLSDVLISTKLNTLSSKDMRNLEQMLSARMELISQCDCKDLEGRCEVIDNINGITRKIIDYLGSP